MIWTVFGKVMYIKGYYWAAAVERKCASRPTLRNRTRQGQSRVSASVALSGIDKAFEEGRKWLKEYLLFESPSRGTGRNSDTGSPAKTGRSRLSRGDAERSEFENGNKVYTCATHPDGSMDAAKVRIEPRENRKKRRKTGKMAGSKAGCWYQGRLTEPTTFGTTEGEGAT